MLQDAYLQYTCEKWMFLIANGNRDQGTAAGGDLSHAALHNKDKGEDENATAANADGFQPPRSARNKAVGRKVSMPLANCLA